jgi:hypothetical protein
MNKPAASTSDDRRACERFSLRRGAKVYRPASRTFCPAWTRDVSESGVLIEIITPRALSIGEQLQIVVAWGDEALVRNTQALPATVVRTSWLDDGAQRVALRFDARQTLASAA